MNKVYLGKYVNTHGLKGEIRILSNFEYKDKVFKIGNKIIINNVEYTLTSHRVHKVYDMITLDGIDSIDKIPFPKNISVYVDRDAYLDTNDYLDSDLIGFMVYNSKLSEMVTDILYLTTNKKLLKCNTKLIPFELIDNIDLKNKKIKIMEVLGLWK